MNFTITYLALYFIGLVIITYYSSRKQSVGQFLNSDKSLTVSDSAWTTFASLLTGYNFVVGVTFAYLFGLWFLMAFVGAGFAFVALYFLYKRSLSRFQAKYDFFSIGDYFGIMYGNSTKLIVNITLCFSLLLFLIMQMYVNTGLFAALLHLSKPIALLLTSGTVCIYLWFGGFKASVKTDIFQGILMLPIVLIIFASPMHFTWEKIPLALDKSQFWFAVGLALLQFLSLTSQAESFQRVFAVKNARVLKRSLIIAFTLLTIVACSVSYIGINFRMSGIQTDPSTIFSGTILTLLPQWLSSLLLVSLIAAFMGTIDSSAFALGVLITHFPKIPFSNTVRSVRSFTLAGLAISAVASIYLPSFLQSVFALISITSVIGSAVLCSMLFRLNATQTNVFLSAGILVFLTGLLMKFVTDNPMTALIPSGVALLTLSLYSFSIRLYQRFRAP